MVDWLRRAGECRERGDLGRAIDLLEEAVAIGDESSEICKELARLSLSVNEVRAFANWCHEAMRIDPSDYEPHFMIGRLLMDGGRWEEACEAFRAALDREIAEPTVRKEAERLLDQSAREHALQRLRTPGFSNL